MAGELKLNNVSVATESGGTVTVGNSNLTFDASTVTTNLAFAANHAGIKTALNASGNPGVYAARAWVNFNGTGTVSIRSSGNVSSLTDNGTGLTNINFTVAMPDANYSAAISANVNNSNDDIRRNARIYGWFTTYVRCSTGMDGGSDSKEDQEFVNVTVFR